MRRVDEFDQLFRRGELIGDIFQQYFHTQRLGEGAQVFHRGHGSIELALIEALIAIAQMLHQKAEGYVLGAFEGALDLIGGLDLALAVGLNNIDGLHGAAPKLFFIVEHGRMQ